MPLFLETSSALQNSWLRVLSHLPKVRSFWLELTLSLSISMLVSSLVIEVIETVFFYFFMKDILIVKKHKQKHLSNIQPNISASKKNI